MCFPMNAPINDVARMVAAALVVGWFAQDALPRSLDRKITTRLTGLEETGEQSGADSSKRTASEVAQTAFDVGAAKMPARFRGNTVEWVLRYGTLAPRNGFETNSEYTARRMAFRSEVFAFVIDRYDLSYDRAAETATVLVRPVTTRFSAHGG